jgi:hypothetical protein
MPFGAGPQNGVNRLLGDTTRAAIIAADVAADRAQRGRNAPRDYSTREWTRSTLATRPFGSRFMPAKRPSRFSSRRIWIRCRKNVGASRLSTFPVTSLAKLPPQRRDVPQALSCIPGVASDFATRAVNLWHDPVTAASRGALVYAGRRPARQNTPVPFPNGTPESMERSVARSAPRGLASPGPPSVADQVAIMEGRLGKEGVPQSLIGYPSEESLAGSHRPKYESSTDRGFPTQQLR